MIMMMKKEENNEEEKGRPRCVVVFTLVIAFLYVWYTFTMHYTRKSRREALNK